MLEKSGIYNKEYDLQDCNKEPLLFIRQIQSYGSLIVLSKDYRSWVHVSEDLHDLFKDKTLDNALLEIFGLVHLEELKACKQDGESFDFVKDEQHYNTIVHLSAEHVIIEVEPHSPAQKKQKRDFHDILFNISARSGFSDILDVVVDEIKYLTEYDSVMIYKFDEVYNGLVIKELKEESMPSYLGLKFPHTDIPEQARALYFEENIRLINDTNSVPKNIVHNSTQEHLELNLRKVHARGVSPIHIEYLVNMGVVSSFSVAIIHENRLWGLIACHNRSINHIDVKKRKDLKFLSQFISLSISKSLKGESDVEHLEDKLTQFHFLENLTSTHDLVGRFLEEGQKLNGMLHACGMYIKAGEEIGQLGEIPSAEIIDRLLEEFDKMDEFDSYASKQIRVLLDDDIDHKIAGVLAIQISKVAKDYILFFREEELHSVNWAGDPTNVKAFDPIEGRMSPRKSFKKWRSAIRGTSVPWTKRDLGIADHLKKEIRSLIYMKYNELATLNAELQEAYKDMESFGYTVSHDLKAPMRNVRSFSQILRSEYGSNMDEYGIKVLDMIENSIEKMYEFIEGILHYSKLNKSQLRISTINLEKMIQSAWEVQEQDNKEVSPSLDFPQNFPPIFGDKVLIEQIFSNLFSNAIKYRRAGLSPKIVIFSELKEKFVKLSVSDNGIGIPENKAKRVFDVFSRLVDSKEYTGTGVGLAIVKKVVNRHGSSIRVEPNESGGSVFIFELPTNANFVALQEQRSS